MRPWNSPCVVMLVASLVSSGLGGGLIAEEFPEPRMLELEGWSVAMDVRLDDPAHLNVRDKALAALTNHLQRIALVVPAQRLQQLRTLPIWIELDNAALARLRQENMQYHPDRGWLTRNGLDPRLEKHVHIPRAEELYARRMWEKHPYVVLHELAHAFHDQILGFDDAEIIASYEAAKAEGRYEDVLLFTGKRVKHYGLTNHKEYFAEATEAFFGVNDFYPFVRAELREHDPRLCELLERLWKVKE